MSILPPKRSASITVFIVAGETSGDMLGAKLMRALRNRHVDIQFVGVGGEAMCAEGLKSLFPMMDIAVMGFIPVIKRLPILINRISRTVKACIALKPDVFVAIDSPDFTHRVARRVRASKPDIPIVNYVSPTVWAWRPGRAKAMRAYIDYVLALLPFEPAVYDRLGGPPCRYVGHPLIERLGELRPQTVEEHLARSAELNVLLLPGSRTSEVVRLMPIFREVVEEIVKRIPRVKFQLPIVPHVASFIRKEILNWKTRPDIIEGEDAKLSAFRSARAALAASGTVTLELGLSGIPMVAAYKVSKIEEKLVRAMIQVDTVLLPSLIIGERFVPELLQADATARKMVDALLPLIEGGSAREAQMEKFHALDKAMQVKTGNPSDEAAAVVLNCAINGRNRLLN